MKKLILAIIIFAATLTFAQAGQDGWTYAITIDTAGAGLNGIPFKLSEREIPIAVWVDTLTDASTLSFEIIFGDTTGYSSSSEEMWRWLTLQEDSTKWSTILTDDRITPLDPSIMVSLLGKRVYRKQNVFIRPSLSGKQDEPIILYIRVRWL